MKLRDFLLLVFIGCTDAYAFPSPDATGQSFGTVDADMQTHIISNIGNNSTDFRTDGGLTTAAQIRAPSYNGTTDNIVVFNNNAGTGDTLLRIGTTSDVVLCSYGSGTAAFIDGNASTCAVSGTMAGVASSGWSTYNGSSVRKTDFGQTGMNATSDAYVSFGNSTALGGNDTGFKRAVAGALCLTSSDPTSCTGAIGSVGRQTTRRSTDVTTTATDFSTSTGMTVALAASTTYTIHAYLRFDDATAADGAQFDFNGGATLTATDFRMNCKMILAGSTAFEVVTSVTALTTAISDAALASTSVGDVTCDGTLTVGTGGTFGPRFAKVAHSAGNLTLHRGSYVTAEYLP